MDKGYGRARFSDMRSSLLLTCCVFSIILRDLDVCKMDACETLSHGHTGGFDLLPRGSPPSSSVLVVCRPLPVLSMRWTKAHKLAPLHHHIVPGIFTPNSCLHSFFIPPSLSAGAVSVASLKLRGEGSTEAKNHRPQGGACQ